MWRAAIGDELPICFGFAHLIPECNCLIVWHNRIVGSMEHQDFTLIDIWLERHRCSQHTMEADPTRTPPKCKKTLGFRRPEPAKIARRESAISDETSSRDPYLRSVSNWSLNSLSAHLHRCKLIMRTLTLQGTAPTRAGKGLSGKKVHGLVSFRCGSRVRLQRAIQVPRVPPPATSREHGPHWLPAKDRASQAPPRRRALLRSSGSRNRAAPQIATQLGGPRC
jgi:hypothetical protein